MMSSRSSLPRWEDNYAPFYCPENPLPRRPRRSSPSSRLLSPEVRHALANRTGVQTGYQAGNQTTSRPSSYSYDNRSSHTRRHIDTSLGPQVGRRPRYGPGANDVERVLPTNIRFFSGEDRNTGVIGCTVCCCFFFCVPAVLVIILGSTSSSSSPIVNPWAGVAVLIVSIIFLIIFLFVQCKGRLPCKQRQNVEVLVNVSPPAYGSISNTTAGDSNTAAVDGSHGVPPPEYTVEPMQPSSAQACGGTSSGENQVSRAALSVALTSHNLGQDGQTNARDRPPTYDEAIRRNPSTARSQELDRFPLLSG